MMTLQKKFLCGNDGEEEAKKRETKQEGEKSRSS